MAVIDAAASPPAVEFDDVRKAFSAGRPVLDGFSLTVGPAETVALLGPSGSGKTTALKLVNRLASCDSGAVRVFGKDVAREEPVRLRRRIGYVIQEAGLFPHWTVEQNVATVPRLVGWDEDTRRTRAASALSMVGLPPAEFGARRPRELSGGQRQRVGVARAVAADPVLVLMDEPFGALDPIARRALQAEFLAWKKALGKPVLFVTHDLAEAFRLADRVAVLNRGRLAQVGTPAEIRKSPADAFVREFVSEDA
jgi:osmoprotectant transport system ATP-binding protein